MRDFDSRFNEDGLLSLLRGAIVRAHASLTLASHESWLHGPDAGCALVCDSFGRGIAHEKPGECRRDER